MNDFNFESEPTHPGVMLLIHIEEIIQETNKPLTLKTVAASLNIPLRKLSEIIKGKRSVTPELALKLSEAFGGPAEYWTLLQHDYDLAIEKQSYKYGTVTKLSTDYVPVIPPVKPSPYTELTEKGKALLEIAQELVAVVKHEETNLHPAIQERIDAVCLWTLGALDCNECGCEYCIDHAVSWAAKILSEIDKKYPPTLVVDSSHYIIKYPNTYTEPVSKKEWENGWNYYDELVKTHITIHRFRNTEDLLKILNLAETHLLTLHDGNSTIPFREGLSSRIVHIKEYIIQIEELNDYISPTNK